MIIISASIDISHLPSEYVTLCYNNVYANSKELIEVKG